MEEELETMISRLEKRVAEHHDKWAFMDITQDSLRALLQHIRGLEAELDDLYRQAAYNN